jgi:hypothetical protein
MARAMMFVGGLVCGVLLTTSLAVSHADDVQAEVLAAASAAHVSPVDLAGAVATTGLDPYTYLRSTGELPAEHTLPPSTPNSPAASASGVFSSRVACLEAKESQGLNVANQRGSGAVGVLQYMPTTFAAHAAEMGHPEYSPWNPTQARAVAAHDLALGRRGQWTVGGC